MKLAEYGRVSLSGQGGVGRVVMAGAGPAFRFVGTHTKNADPGTFEVPRPESADRASGFKVGYIGAGAWSRDMDVIVVLRDGKRVTLKFNLWKHLSGQ